MKIPINRRRLKAAFSGASPDTLAQVMPPVKLVLSGQGWTVWDAVAGVSPNATEAAMTRTR